MYATTVPAPSSEPNACSPVWTQSMRRRCSRSRWSSVSIHSTVPGRTASHSLACSTGSRSPQGTAASGGLPGAGFSLAFSVTAPPPDGPDGMGDPRPRTVAEAEADRGR